MVELLFVRNAEINTYVKRRILKLSALNKFNEVWARYEKAIVYMDKPYNLGLKGAELESAIRKREKHVKGLRELMKEAHQCMNNLNQV